MVESQSVEFESVDEQEEIARHRLNQLINGRFRLVGLLGTGGMGAVYEALDPAGQRVAVKMLHPGMARRSDIRERFLREGAAAKRIDHPGVVRILEQSSPGDTATILVMEMLEGQPLNERVREQQGFPLALLLDCLDQVLDVLKIAHEQRIVHRDLKPANLFVTREGRVKVLDFGIARALDGLPEEKLTKTGITLGTVPFMSPEQALGKRDEIDARADLFSLGALAFWILTGRHVHEAEGSAAQLVAMATKPAPRLASVARAVPAQVCAVIDMALAFSKEARYPDAATMQADVQALRRGEAPAFALRAHAAQNQATNFEMPGARMAAAAVGGRSAMETRVGPGHDAVTVANAHGAALGGQKAPVSRDVEPVAYGSLPHSEFSKETIVGPAPDQVTVVATARPVSGAAVARPAAAGLQTLGSAVGTSAPSHGSSRDASPEDPRRNLLLLAGVLCGVLLAIGGLYAWYGGESTEESGAEVPAGKADFTPSSKLPQAKERRDQDHREAKKRQAERKSKEEEKRREAKKRRKEARGKR